MAKWGSADFKQLQELQKRLENLQEMDLNKFCEDASKELAARLLALVIPRTPVGEYDIIEEQITAKRNSKHHRKGETYTKRIGSDKNGGTLLRGWTAGKEIPPSAYKTYAKSLPIEKSGDYYIIRVINPVKYASYVEFGHRQTPGRYVPAIGKRLKQGWVNGQYFLTVSEDDLKSIAPAMLQKKLDKLLQEAFNG